MRAMSILPFTMWILIMALFGLCLAFVPACERLIGARERER